MHVQLVLSLIIILTTLQDLREIRSQGGRRGCHQAAQQLPDPTRHFSGRHQERGQQEALCQDHPLPQSGDHRGGGEGGAQGAPRRSGRGEVPLHQVAGGGVPVTQDGGSGQATAPARQSHLLQDCRHQTGQISTRAMSQTWKSRGTDSMYIPFLKPQRINYETVHVKLYSHTSGCDANFV